MKKSILIGALAVLMLFAFTACDNNAPTSPLYGKKVMGVTLQSAPDYIEGIDEIVPSEITLRVTYDDDTYADFKGNELGMTVPELKAGVNEVEVTYANVKYPVIINGYAVTSYTLDLTGVKQTEIVKSATAAVSLEGAKFSVSYANGTRELTTDDYDFEKTYDASAAEVGSTITLIKAGEYTDDAKITVIGNFAVKVVAAPVDVPENVSVALTKGTEIFAGTTIEEVPYTMTFTLGDNTVELTNDSHEGWTLEITNIVEDYELAKAGDSEEITVLATNEDNPSLTATGSFKVTVIKDYPKAFTVTKNEEAMEKDKKTGFVPGETVDPKYFTFTVASWASSNSTTCADSETPETALKSSDFTALTTIKKGLNSTNNTGYTVEFAYKNAGAETENAKTTVDVTLPSADVEEDE